MNRLFLWAAIFFSGLFPLFADISSNNAIDVVIPCVEKDLFLLDHCIQGIKKNGVNIRRIIVISKKHLTDQAEWFNESNYPFTFEDVAKFLAKGNPEVTRYLLQQGSRTGWYYQQLLKLYAPLIIPDISPNVLVLDADVIFLNPVAFLNEENAAMYNPGTEYHPPYFLHAGRLIPGFYKCFTELSGISHHMLFQKSIIDSLLSAVEHKHGLPFWQIFCQLVDERELPYSGASEYEIYFNYAFSHRNDVLVRPLKWKNIQKLNHMEECKKQGFHYVCLHSYERIEE